MILVTNLHDTIENEFCKELFISSRLIIIETKNPVSSFAREYLMKEKKKLSGKSFALYDEPGRVYDEARREINYIA